VERAEEGSRVALIDEDSPDQEPREHEEQIDATPPGDHDVVRDRPEGRNVERHVEHEDEGDGYSAQTVQFQDSSQADLHLRTEVGCKGLTRDVGPLLWPGLKQGSGPEGVQLAPALFTSRRLHRDFRYEYCFVSAKKNAPGVVVRGLCVD